MNIEVVILAAGQGTRMKSALPKVMHPLAGKPMLQHVIDSASQLPEAAIQLVIGHGADLIRQAMADQSLRFTLQEQQLGTGHAVLQTLPHCADDAIMLILYGDVPLIQYKTMAQMVALASHQQLALLTVNLDDPTGYGRILRNTAHEVVAIVEQKDASSEQLKVTEVNTGIMALQVSMLREWLPQLSSSNAQGEYYLTDIIAMAANAGVPIATLQPDAEQEVQGVNNRQQLALLERWYQLQQAQQLMADGVTLPDPQRIDIRGRLQTGRDLFIDVNCVFEGEVELGDGVVIGPNCVIRNSRIGAHTRIEANSMLDGVIVADNASIGPFARLRPGTELATGARIGNFVETKKAQIGAGSKVNHLSYIGDAEVGEQVNIGAGTITCNYDGVNKFKTEIGNGAFIGSNTSLVAPVSVGDGATIGAGSTITKTVGEQQLAVARGKQINLDSWKRPTKTRS
ncbi:bifunctional UDP-N-acetylglucosamine diphosphorylase/glucosamine-1-phosphate N-acetyltransferase GlmU [Nitrincola alkalilacustris]|uniref:bifunctional UDP-N-acetylglucosamine diphosphorylase/glucosamine-1-phosphate N-acetyltransferase GlmU n=1 Tax=Nitrincola alkalilacustris TaxID=1571224 RepID=UPI00124E6C6C|nr:bifunctional UDP-N-acetylglucosamine diphosphorylase/glucosamine-1-phosphate N-acetyltransferase GlmU [Nitrincola alkalilacustris]